MRKRELWKGLIAGGAAGMAGTIAMTQFQNSWSKASEKLKQNGSQQSSSNNSSGQENEDSTMKVAGKLAEATGHELSREAKKKGGLIVHYAFGTGMGALYGTMMELGPRDLRRHALASGIGFGSVLFAGADEIAAPALGLSQKPTETPMSSHFYALASHVVYGLTAGVVGKAVRAAL
jgi:putative membrane protein